MLMKLRNLLSQRIKPRLEDKMIKMALIRKTEMVIKAKMINGMLVIKLVEKMVKMMKAGCMTIRKK